MQRCSYCKEIKEISEYLPLSRGTKRTTCNSCKDMENKRHFRITNRIKRLTKSIDTVPALLYKRMKRTIKDR